MKEEEILEGNKLIADFDKRQYQPYKDNHSYDVYFNTYKECEDWIKKNNLNDYFPELDWGIGFGKYNDSWDWLMPVLEKIELHQFEDGEYAHIRSFGHRMVRINRFTLHQEETKLQSAWCAIIEFINWYNQTIK